MNQKRKKRSLSLLQRLHEGKRRSVEKIAHETAPHRVHAIVVLGRFLAARAPHLFHSRLPFRPQYTILPLIVILFVAPSILRAFTYNTYAASFVAASLQYAVKSSGGSGLPTGSGARTISFWVKTSDAASQTVVEYGDSASLHLMEFFINVFDPANNFGIALSGGNVSYTATGITNGNWHNVVFVYDGGGVGIATGGHAYMDGGVLTQFGANNQIPATTGACIGIGTETCNGLGAYMNGQVDDVRIWGRALTAAEVSSLYANPCTFSNGASLASWYLLDNNFTDSQGSNSLTATNAPTFTQSTAYACKNIPFFEF